MLDSGQLLRGAYVFICSLVCLSILNFSTDSLAETHNSKTKLPVIQNLERIKNRTGIGAVSFALVEEDRIIAMGGLGKYGHKNPRQVTESSLFRVGSITKTFTSLALMHLVEQGKLRLNQAVKNIDSNIPLDNPWPESPVTLEMLLEHTAGIQDMTRGEFDYPDPLSLQAALNLKPEARRVKWQPGYHYVYSNQGAGYIGRVIELVTKENYDDWFEREILHKLDMRDSQLRWSKKLQQNLVTGYDADLESAIPYWHTLYRPFGGLNTTASDMAKFLMLFTKPLKSDNKLVTESALNRIETPETSLAAKAGMKTGYGLGIRSDYFKGHKLYGHNGDGDGYLAEFAYSKESQRAYFVVINAFRHDILNSYTGLLNNWLIENTPRENKKAQKNKAGTLQKPPIKTLSSDRISLLTGEYRETTQRFPFMANRKTETLRIKHIDKGLFRCFSHLKKCMKILPITEELFRTEDARYPSMAFVNAADGNIYLQASFGNYQKEK